MQEDLSQWGELLCFTLTARWLETDERDIEPGRGECVEAPALTSGCDLRCVRWYIAYPLRLWHLEETMAERGISVDHSTVHRWAIKLLSVLERDFRRSKRQVRRIRKGQMKSGGKQRTPAQQFYSLAA